MVARMKRSLVLSILCATACASPAAHEQSPSNPSVAVTEHDAFWSSLQALCGRHFGGRMVEGTEPSDADMRDAKLVMHVASCTASEVRIPFHVGADRSRTWVLTRREGGLRLKHDHRHEDGTEDAVSQYGGDTVAPGSAQRQEFPADAFTAELLPRAATNVWAVEVNEAVFAYALTRASRRFRVEFDLTKPLAPR